MFAVNLKSLICVDSFKLSRNICCCVYRAPVTIKSPPKDLSRRYFATKLFKKNEKKAVITPIKINNLIYRQEATKKISDSPIRWKTVLIVAVIGSTFVLLLNYLKNEKLRRIEAQRTRELGKAKLGGKFDLIDQDNKPVKSDDFLGQWLLIYFGFTHCPDICPDELEKMVQVIDKIDNDKDMLKVKPIFITVDPDRDTPSVIKKYLKEFSDKFIGLTGSRQQIADVCKAYRIYFSSGPKDSDNDYIVDHSIIMYLIDPDGKFIDYYGQNKSAEDIVNSIHFNQAKQMVQKSLFEKAIDLISK